MNFTVIWEGDLKTHQLSQNYTKFFWTEVIQKAIDNK